MKKLILTTSIVLLASTTFAADKWSGPTSPINPMWGMKGSSIMSEALRDNQPTYQQQQQMRDKDRRIRELQEEVDGMKSKRKSDLSVSIWDD